MTDPMPIVLPSEGTLAKYGLTIDEWLDYIPEVDGVRVCAIHLEAPRTGRFVVDHQHVAGWKGMPPESRKRYVRGVICTTCNHYILTRYGNPLKHRQAADYLEQYERRLAEWQASSSDS
jgi:hypothetical protein